MEQTDNFNYRINIFNLPLLNTKQTLHCKHRLCRYHLIEIAYLIYHRKYSITNESSNSLLNDFTLIHLQSLLKQQISKIHQKIMIIRKHRRKHARRITPSTLKIIISVMTKQLSMWIIITITVIPNIQHISQPARDNNLRIPSNIKSLRNQKEDILVRLIMIHRISLWLLGI